PGQLTMISAEHGQAALARACATAAYEAGAKYVEPLYYDTRVKRERVLHADPDTLDYVPPWWAQRLLEVGDQLGARISLAGISTPSLFADLDPALVGRDRMPWIKEVSQVIAEQSTNWCIVPCPHVEWAKVVFPDLPEEEALERLWSELEHVLRLDEPDPNGAWDERMAVLDASAQTLTERRFDAIELRGPGTELTIGLLPSGRFLSAQFERRDGLRHIANLPTEEVFTSPDPQRADGHVTSTKPLVMRDGTVIRGLRVRFDGGRAVEIDADEGAGALQATLAVDDNALRLGELALVDNQGRIGPLGTVFYDTLLDENAASHIALGSGFPFAVDPEDVERVNRSGTHIDFMICSPEVDVDGVTSDGERVPVLRGGAWQI
ncbi:MAG TPA: aminopeptidase, partial [Gaiellaceae bacterium]|nr:aminopeptidase [Gaiellaceae bacterium]